MSRVRVGMVLAALAWVGCRGGESAPPSSPTVALALCDEGPPVAGGWVPLGSGPQGLERLISHPRERELVFAMTRGRALWRSTDGGRRFCPVGLPGAAEAVVVAPSAPAVAYALVAAPERGANLVDVYRSSDGGRTWHRRTSPPERSPPGEVYGAGPLVVHPDEPDTLYAATLRGFSEEFSDASPLRRSTDGAATWTVLGPRLPERCRNLTVAIDPGDPDRLYLSGSFDTGQVRAGVRVDAPILLRYRVTAGTWEVVRRGGRAGLAAIDRSSRLYGYPPSGDGYVRSDDGGGTWLPLPRDLEPGELRGLAAETLAPGDLFALAAGRIGEAALVHSPDGGATWRRLGAAGPAAPWTHGSLQVSGSAPRAFYADAVFGPMRSADDGQTFSRMFLDLGGGTALAVAPSDARVLYLAAGGRVLRSSDEGASWTEHALPGRTMVVHPTDADVLWSFGWELEAIYRSDDGARTWSPWASFRAAQLVPAPAAPHAMWVLADSYSLRVTRDGGQSWVERRIAWPGRSEDAELTGLVRAPLDPEVGYVASDTGALAATSDGWETITIHEAPRGLSGLAVHPGDPRALVAWSDEGVYRSVDGGRTWRDARGEFPFGASPGERRILFHEGRPDVMYALTSEAAWRSSDGGVRWEALGRRDLPLGASYLSLVPDPRGSRTFYLPAWGFGLFKTVSSGI